MVEHRGLFSGLKIAPPDPILGTATAYKADTDPKKMNLGIGAYRTETGKTYIFNVVRKVEQAMVNDPKADKEYLPIDGLPEFTRLSRTLILGEDSPAIRDQRVTTVQALSGTGSLRIGAEFIAEHMPKGTVVYVPSPTWGNHFQIFQRARLRTVAYPYVKGIKLNFEGMKQCLASAPSGSVVLLHACAHNPTGVDPTPEQWQELANLMESRALIPFFDSAYQGFASGSLERDAFAVRMFVQRGFQCFIAQSFAKNLGLYGERVGALSIVCKSKAEATAVLSQVKLVIRPMYSNPPVHGARIAATILGNKELFDEWKAELFEVSQRIQRMRTALRTALERRGTPGTWSHITSQIGMFSYTGLTPEQVGILINKYHIYLLKSGRISMAGINTSNVAYLADAIKDAILMTTKAPRSKL